MASYILGDFTKNSLDVPDETRQPSVKVPAHDSIPISSDMAHSLGPWDSPAWQSALLTLAAERHSGKTPLMQILPLVAELNYGKFWQRIQDHDKTQGLTC